MIRKDPVAEVYAEALIGASGASVLQAEEAFDAFVAAWQSAPEIRSFLLAPNLPTPVKREALKKALAGAPEPFLDFLCLTVDKGRAGSLPAIHQAFRDLRDAAAGRVRVLASR